MRSHEDLSRLADAQYGVVTFRQLIGLGFSKGAIWRMSEARRLCRMHRGVYAVGHTELSRYGRCLAAVLACGDGAVLSHKSAAWLLGLRGDCPRDADVTVIGHGHRRPANQSRQVAPAELAGRPGHAHQEPGIAAARLVDVGWAPAIEHRQNAGHAVRGLQELAPPPGIGRGELIDRCGR